MKAITVWLMDLSWMLRDKRKFLRLTQILSATESDSIFVTQFVKQVLDQFWDKNFWILLKYQFLPYLVCLTTTIVYLQYALEHNDSDRADKLAQRTIFGLITMALQMHQIYHEAVQLRASKGFTDHFSSIWNANDAILLTLCPVIIITSIPSETWIDISNLGSLAAFATFSMFVKVFDWMRLFG